MGSIEDMNEYIDLVTQNIQEFNSLEESGVNLINQRIISTIKTTKTNRKKTSRENRKLSKTNHDEKNHVRMKKKHL